MHCEPQTGLGNAAERALPCCVVWHACFYCGQRDCLVVVALLLTHTGTACPASGGQGWGLVVLNDDGSDAAVLHQYDRFKALEAQIATRYDG